MSRLLARCSGWMLRAFFVLLVAAFFVALGWWATMAGLVALYLLTRVRPRPLADPAAVETPAPVTGEWVGLNSPADKVPSHGTHGYGQTYAIDICGPTGRDEPRKMGLGWTARAPEEFTAFGRPVLAVADGTVVRSVDAMRDHRSRESLLAVMWMMSLEGMVREVCGLRWILGNHLVVDHGQGRYAVYAHLRRGSVAVVVGDRVDAGQKIAEVGNTGNTSEPHLHVHLMDDPNPRVGRGLPFRWTNLDQQPDDLDLGITWGQKVNGEVTPGVPASAQLFRTVDVARTGQD